MLKKYKEWKKKPVTWGDYIKMYKWCMGASVIVAAIEIAWLRWDRKKLYEFDEKEVDSETDYDDDVTLVI